MVFEELNFKLATLGKSEEEKLKITRLAETKEHLSEAYKQCKEIIEEEKLPGIDCICNKLKDEEWIDQDNVRLRSIFK
jgi:hypothetical protein